MLLKAKLSNILGSISEGNIPRLKKNWISGFIPLINGLDQLYSSQIWMDFVSLLV